MPFPQVVDVDVTGSVSQGEVQYYRYDFTQTGLTVRLSISNGYILCYISDTNQNPNSRQGYDWIVTATSYSDIFIDPLLLGREAGDFLYVAIEGGQPGSNSFSLNATNGDRRGSV